jgi:hypothetical protein
LFFFPLQISINTISFNFHLNTIKVNWDAAIDKKMGRVGFRIIFRDSKGNVLATRSTTISISIDPAMAETWATLHVVMFINEIEIFDIIIEGDAMQVVNKINSK